MNLCSRLKMVYHFYVGECAVLKGPKYKFVSTRRRHFIANRDVCWNFLKRNFERRKFAFRLRDCNIYVTNDLIE